MASINIGESRKRKRDEGDESPLVLQRKMFVNERLMDCHSAEKLKEIHKNTMSMLFKAARKLTATEVSGKALDPTAVKPHFTLSKQILLRSNGEIQLRNFSNKDDLSLNRLKAKCCERETFVQDNCSNCSLALCEYCGYSCTECDAFLCGNCVCLFGCGTAERPICENCAFYK